MKAGKAGELVFWTYHMVDWNKVEQSPSDQRCVQCGGPIKKVGPVEVAKSSRYDGFVCHACRRVVWAKRR